MKGEVEKKMQRERKKMSHKETPDGCCYRMAVQRTVLYPFVFHTSYVSTYHCHKNKSVFGYEGHRIDFGIEAQKLELKQKMTLAMSKKKTTDKFEL